MVNVDVGLLMQFITNPLMPVPWLPALLVGAAPGFYLGLQYVKSKTPNMYKVFEAKAFKNGIPLLLKPYKYGVVLESDGSGTIKTARLHMHNKKDKMYQDPKTKRPRIVNRKNIEYGVTESRMDGVPLTMISIIDPVEGTPMEKRAATIFLEKARQKIERDGKTVFKYPCLSAIPSKEANKIADMVFAIDDDELEALSKSYTHVDKNFMIQDTIRTPAKNDKGEELKDDAGNVLYEEQLAFDDDGKPLYRKPNQEEIKAYRDNRATVLANEAKMLRQEISMTNVDSGVTVLDALYSIVTRPWLDEEVDVIDTQNEQAKYDEKKEKKQQDARVDNTLILVIGGAVAFAIILAALKYVAGVI